MNGRDQHIDLWDRFGHEPSAYLLGLAALALGDDEQELAGLTPDGFRARVVDLLPASVTRLLQRLVVHARPLPRAHAPPDTDDRTLEVGALTPVSATWGEPVKGRQ